MFKDAPAFSSFSVDNLQNAKEFYSQTLGLVVEESPMGLTLKTAGNNDIFIYQKDDHQPATFTVLNFPVDDIDQAADELKGKGVTFEQYPPMTDANGIARGTATGDGPDIAWFKDPAGNVISILHG